MKSIHFEKLASYAILISVFLSLKTYAAGFPQAKYVGFAEKKGFLYETIYWRSVDQCDYNINLFSNWNRNIEDFKDSMILKKNEIVMLNYPGQEQSIIIHSDFFGKTGLNASIFQNDPYSNFISETAYKHNFNKNNSGELFFFTYLIFDELVLLFEIPSNEFKKYIYDSNYFVLNTDEPVTTIGVILNKNSILAKSIGYTSSNKN